MKNRLKELRKTRDWSQAELARSLEISRQAINGFESGKFTPSLEMAFKIAVLFNVPIEQIFLYQEKTVMETIAERIVSITQWLPKGEKFTHKAIEAIKYAQQKAALSPQSQVEPQHLLYGLLNSPTTTAARLLRENGLTLNLDNPAIIEGKMPEITDFSPESKYVLEQALNAARLKQKKYIETEHLLLGLIQLLQLGNSDLEDIFQQYEVDKRSLLQQITEAI